MPSSQFRRFGSVLRVRPESFEEYRRAHSAVWPEVLATLTDNGIRNFSIFHHEGWLFSYFEYGGTDYSAAAQRIAADPATQRWWALMERLQIPLPTRAAGEWWAQMQEVFHHD
jgi:L-rhamnose mutarotase